MSQASQIEMNRFIKVVDDFMANYSVLISAGMRSDVYATGNANLISDYESAVSRGGLLKSTIESTVGAWNAAKRGWASVTDTTSMVIGDAVDWIKSLFGDSSPGVGDASPGLGALQIPAAVWVAGIVAAAYTLNSLMTKIFVSVEANKIQRDNPGLSRTDALRRASSAIPSLLGEMNWPLLIGGGLLAAYFLMDKKR